MRAREYFESVRAEVIRLERSRSMLERLRAREGARAQTYGISSGLSAGGDPMDAVGSRIDMEGRMAALVARAEADIDAATEVLYGRDGRGGLAKLKGSRYSDAVCLYYVQGSTWTEAAAEMECSRQWCRALAAEAFSYIDRVGWAEVKDA